MLQASNLKYIPWIIGLGLLMENIDISIINTAIPQMAISLGCNPISLKIGITSYLLTLAAFIPISGYMADKYGAQNTFFWAMLVFLFGSLCCGFAHSIWELVFGRLIQGAGGAMMTPVGRLILIKTHTKAQLVKAFSSLTMLGQAGVAIGPVLGGALSGSISWRSIFFVNIPFGILALRLIKRYIPNTKADMNDKFDFFGFGIFAIAAGLISFSTSLISDNNDFARVYYYMLLIGVVVMGIFYLHSKAAMHPSLKLDLFRVRTFRIAVLGSLVMRISIGGIPFLLPLLLQVGYNYTPLESGLTVLPYGVAMVLAKPLVKKCLAQYGFKNMLTINPIIMAILLMVLAFATQNLNIYFVLLIVFLLGFFSSMQFTYMNLLNFVDIEKADDSKATSLSSVMQQLSMSFGVSTSAALLSGFNIPILGSAIKIVAFRDTFILLSIICFSTLLIFRLLKHTDGKSILK